MLKKITEYLQNLFYSSKVQLLVTILIIVAIALTIFLMKNPQIFKSRAQQGDIASFEAESATSISSPATIISDPNASGGQYVQFGGNTGPTPTPGPGYHVSLSGSDSNPGTQDQPWKTISSAVSKLKTGDNLYIHSGTYYEKPTVSISGTSGSPITIQSYPGERATIDSGYPEFRTAGNNDWELVDATLGEYRSVKTYSSSGTIYAYIAGIPNYENERVLLVPYKSATMFRSTTDQYNTSAFYVGPGTFYDSLDNRIHIRLAKTTDLKATESRYGQIFNNDLPDPRNYSIITSQSPSTLIIGGSYLNFKDITFNQGQNTINLGSSAHDINFEKITAWNGEKSILGQYSGNYNIKVKSSRIYGDNPYWIFWSDQKDSPYPADYVRGTSIDMRGGAHDWEVSYSHLRGSGQDTFSVNNNEYNLKVHHNRIENCGDDAFELEGTTNVGRIEIFENYIGNCLVAIAPGQDSAGFTGPLLVYRNVIALLKNPPINRVAGINTWNGGGRFGYEYMFKQSGSAYATRNAHYYHNTLIMLNTGSGNGLSITPKNPQDIRIANNLLIMINGVINKNYIYDSSSVINGNLYWKVNTVDSASLLSSYDTVSAFSTATGLEKNGIGGISKRGTDPLFANLPLGFADKTQSIWVLNPSSEVLKPTDFLLSASSPAIGKGISIPSHPTLGILPDTKSSNDMGALPFGTGASEYNIFPYIPTLNP